MNLDALRTWGIAASGAFIAGALAVSFSATSPANQEETAPAPVAFVAHFRGTGPIARAQALAARDPARAARLIETELARQEAFDGLCFDRFTPGAAALVLRSCDPVPAGLAVSTAARLLARLRAMAAVEYAEEGALADPAGDPQGGEP